MRVRATTDAPAATGADTIAIGVFDGEGIAHDVEGGVLQALVDSGEARSKLRRVTVAHAGGLRYVLAGLGPRDGFDPESARVAAAVAAGRAREMGARVLCWELPHHVEDAHAAALVEGTVLADYDYRAYKTGSDDRAHLDELIVSAHHDVAGPVGVAAVVAEAVNAARDLQNSPANDLTPTALAARARALPGVEVDVWGREEIEAAGMGAFAGVARGSDEEPRLITIRYEGEEARGPRLGFVGKGVTFDSGGLSIKPTDGMKTMKCDMAGAATVLGALQAIARLKLPEIGRAHV